MGQKKPAISQFILFLRNCTHVSLVHRDILEYKDWKAVLKKIFSKQKEIDNYLFNKIDINSANINFHGASMHYS